MLRMMLIIMVLLFLSNCPTLADTIWTSGHHEVFNSDIYGEIYIYNDTTVDIFGGDIYRLAAYDTTETTWYEGEMTALWLLDDSVINVFGGSLERFDPQGNGLLNLYAYDVMYHTTGGYWGYGWVEGNYLGDDSHFSFDVPGVESFSHINVVPEPSTILLLGIGGLLIGRRSYKKTRKS